MPRVLHVTESYGGGVASAISDYVLATPDIEHFLLRRNRPGEHIEDLGAGTQFAAIMELGRGVFGARRAIRRATELLQPTSIHAHSSLAGAYVRTAVSRKSWKIVYSPHCYAFERRDVPKLIRLGFLLGEFALARNTSVVAACSLRELRLAQRLGGASSTVFVPNVAHGTQRVHRLGRDQHRASYRVVTMGRVAPQKDPRFFSEVVDALRLWFAEVEVESMWIGSGPETSVQDLAAGGTNVSGWTTRPEAIHLLSESDLYLHTARWEGFPLAVLEAHAVGLPVLVRSIDAFDGISDCMGASNPEDLAKRAFQLLTISGARERNVALWADYLRHNTPDMQSRTLSAVYSPRRPAL